MNDMLYPSAFVVTAIIGWGLYVRGSHRTGNTLLAMSLAGLWCLAVLHREHHQSQVTPSIVHRSQSTVHAAELTANGASSTVWVSTLDRAKKVYHRPTCQYAGLMVHKKPLSPEEAEAAGYEPCSKCFSIPMRLATQSAQP